MFLRIESISCLGRTFFNNCIQMGVVAGVIILQRELSLKFCLRRKTFSNVVRYLHKTYIRNKIFISKVTLLKSRESNKIKQIKINQLNISFFF